MIDFLSKVGLFYPITIMLFLLFLICSIILKNVFDFENKLLTVLTIFLELAAIGNVAFFYHCYGLIDSKIVEQKTQTINLISMNDENKDCYCVRGNTDGTLYYNMSYLSGSESTSLKVLFSKSSLDEENELNTPHVDVYEKRCSDKFILWYLGSDACGYKTNTKTYKIYVPKGSVKSTFANELK